jgi:dTDP-4-amino-4,6-dideoxygalactose transaminase
VHPRLSIWPPLPPDVYLRRPLGRLPYPLEEPDCRVIAWARHGVWHGVRQLGLGEGDELLVPAWHHGSEVEALHRAGVGVRFYDCAPGELAPDADELEALLGERVRGLYLTHALGFPQDSARWRDWCDARGLLLIEDAAQAWLASEDGRPVGSSGDLAFFCLYKTFGLPEGAAMIQASPPPPVGLDRRLGALELARRHGMWLAGRSAVAYAASAPLRRPKVYDPARDFELRDPHSAPWSHTPFVLRRISDPAAAGRRRENYAALLAGLGDLVAQPFASLPAGASPFVFPIASERKPRLLAGLREQGIGGLDLWAVPHPSLPVDRFPGAAARRARLVGLPVHQELRPVDIERMVAAVRAL